MTKPLRIAIRSGIACLCIAVILLTGCTNTIHLSEIPSESRKTYLVDLGHHTRLAFELPDGAFVEYGYGERRWYANMQNQWWRVPAVLFWPTQATLGRREWHGPRAEARLLEEYDGLIVAALPAEKNRLDALVARLDREFNRQSERLVRNPVYRLDFVPSDRPYWLFNNSNHAVKAWLQEAGFTVTGSGVFAEWRVCPPFQQRVRRRSRCDRFRSNVTVHSV